TIQAGGVSDDPRARAAPPSQGMSPTAKALLALLAIYAMKNMRRAGAPPTQPAGPAGGNVSAGLPGGQGGDLGDLLRGTLGGVLGGAAAGTVLNGGLDGLLKQLQQSGQGDVARSWVGTGPNKAISQGDLANALGTHTLDELSEQTGMGRADLLSGLSQHLPRFVDQLTPAGRLPTYAEPPPMAAGASAAPPCPRTRRRRGPRRGCILCIRHLRRALRGTTAPHQQRHVEPIGVGAARGHQQPLLRRQDGVAEKIGALAERARNLG